MLNILFDSTKLHNSISIKGHKVKTLKEILKLMMIIRKTEEKFALEKKKGID